jgi:hypothetical protein
VRYDDCLDGGTQDEPVFLSSDALFMQRLNGLLLVLAVGLGVVSSGCFSPSPDFLHAPPSVRIFRFDDPDTAQPRVGDLWLDEDELEAVALDTVSVDVLREDTLSRPHRRMAVLHVVMEQPVAHSRNWDRARWQRAEEIMTRAGGIIGADAIQVLKEEARYGEDWSQRRRPLWEDREGRRSHALRALAVRYDR